MGGIVTTLAASVGPPALWMIVLAVAAIVLIAVVALTTTLLYLARSVSLSVQQLREVVGQGQAGPPDADHGDPADGAADPLSSNPSPTPSSASAVEGRVTDRSELKDGD